ncbi:MULTISPECIES: hypothetical protein [Acidiplasma]|jgi:hypothetical protein|uniref:Uncharacterized protein n=3 Tax=Acidiplasma TaxID=507753 RepID=A0A0Q0RU79_9ARCH|nr:MULTISPECIES: hypothetical protein [Acidiplasma]KQB33589.1 hypothetical protein AOG55_02495 [Acidiplasma cupricumulans]WMT55127.1 MAG: hypothetical protein RE470_00420 [Acidiplasma sp.]
MSDENLNTLLMDKNFIKLTGPPEDWLNFLYTGTWGFRDKPRLKSMYNKIDVNSSVFLLHSMHTEYINMPYKIKTGIIGFGFASGKYILDKSDIIPDYGDNFRPLRLQFSKVYLFGDICEIKINAFEKILSSGINEAGYYIDALLRNSISFNDLKDNMVSIQPQGALQELDKKNNDAILAILSKKSTKLLEFSK